MTSVAKELNITLNSKGNKFLIESEKDVDEIVKFLCEYYKKSPVTGSFFGTYSGSIMKKKTT